MKIQRDALEGAATALAGAEAAHGPTSAPRRRPVILIRIVGNPQQRRIARRIVQQVLRASRPFAPSLSPQ
jgi:hypothetical protein